MPKLTKAKVYLLLLFLNINTNIIAQTKAFNEGLKKVYLFEEKEDYKAIKNTLLLLKSNKLLTLEEKIFVENYLVFIDNHHNENASIKEIDQTFQNLASLKKRKPYHTTLLLKLYTEKIHHLANGGDWAGALSLAQKGVEIKDFGQALLETKTDYLYDLGYLYDSNNKNIEAISYYKTSLGLYIKQFGELSTHTALTYNNLAFAYSEAGNEKNAIAYYSKAASIWEKIHKNVFDKDDYLITVYQNLTYQYLEYGDYERAILSGKKLNTHYHKKYSKPENQLLEKYFKAKKSYVLNNIRIHLASKEVADAEALLAQLIKDPHFSYENKADLQYYLQADNEILEYHIRTKNYKDALILAQKILALAQKYKYEHYQMVAYSNICKIYREQKEYAKALKYINLALEHINLDNFNSSKFTLRSVRANINLNLKNYKSAKVETQQNLEALVFELSKNKKAITKIEFNDVKEIVSLNFIKLFTECAKVYLINYKIFKNKSDLVQAEKLYKIASKLFYEYYQKGEYNETLNEYHAEIIEGLLSVAVERKVTKVEIIENINNIEKNASQHLFKEYLKKAYQPQNDNLRTVAKIKDLEGELNYYKNLVLLDKELIAKNNQKINLIESKIKELLKNTPDTYRAIRDITVLNFDINEILKKLRKDETILKYYIGTEYVYLLILTKSNTQLRRLAKVSDLKSTLEAFLNSTKNITNQYQSNAMTLSRRLGLQTTTTKISIIPDGFINYLPFEALIEPQTKQFVVLKHRLSYHYSLPIWLYNQQENKAVVNKKLIAFSPKYNDEKLSIVRAGLADLKFAKEEATTIANLFGGESVKNNEATKKRFLNSINKYGIYHFSMHSQLFQDDFKKSCLVFSNNEKLYLSELYGLVFPAKMAVLSACDTGNGVLKSGEGIMSISRAFTYAGVQSSVYSLWQVPDKETAEIIIEFYKNLKKGEAKDEAMSNAKITFIRNNPLKAHPYFWAGFVVNGNMEPIEKTNFIPWVFALFLLSALIYILYKKRFVQGLYIEQ